MDHWYQTRLATPFASHAERFKHLSDILGDHHDLVILLEHIRDDQLLPLLPASACASSTRRSTWPRTLRQITAQMGPARGELLVPGRVITH